jgi:hypothetical protein
VPIPTLIFVHFKPRNRLASDCNDYRFGTQKPIVNELVAEKLEIC